MKPMGRITAHIKVENAISPSHSIRCDALVDTGAAPLVLPTAWRARLGDLTATRRVTVQLGDQTEKSGEMCGPVKIQVEGFPEFHGEVLFVEMEPEQGSYEALVGYMPLEQSQIAVDMIGHRLLAVRTMDLK